MPTITVNIDDLLSLIGAKLSEGELGSAISSLKCETEAVSGRDLTYEVTSDRPDLFSAEGLARAIRNLLGKPKPETSSAKSPLLLNVGRTVKGIRPFIVAAAVYGSRLNEDALKQIMQLQERLHGTYAAGRRKASIGIYDLDTVKPPFAYEALPPEKISFVPLEEGSRMDGKQILENTLKGREYAPILEGLPRYPVLLDSEGQTLSMPPIINSDATKLGAGTKNLFIDVTGTSEPAINLCLNVISTSILERGGTLGRVDVVYPDRRLETPRMNWTPFHLHLETIHEVSGLELDANSVRNLLGRMGLRASSGRGGIFEVLVPPYRFDIMHEVDLVEDVIMAYGLNEIEPQYPLSAAIGKRLIGSRMRAKARDLMVGMGFQEISTYMLTNKEASAKSMADPGPHAEIEKPLSTEYAAVRGSLVPKLLLFLGSNSHHPCPQRIFEYGDVVNIRDGRAVASTLLSAAISDHSISFEEIQAVSSSLIRNLSTKISYEASEEGAFIQGRCARVLVEGKPIGVIGETKPAVLLGFGISNPTAIMELEMSKLSTLESLFRG
jgi:phenylalanyl-tRNA synthetase beta chain